MTTPVLAVPSLAESAVHGATTPRARLVERFAGRLFLKVTEIAELTESDPRTVRRSIELGQIQAVRIGDTIRIPAAPFWRMAGIDPLTLRPLADDVEEPTEGTDDEPGTGSPLADVRVLTPKTGDPHRAPDIG